MALFDCIISVANSFLLKKSAPQKMIACHQAVGGQHDNLACFDNFATRSNYGVLIQSLNSI